MPPDAREKRGKYATTQDVPEYFPMRWGNVEYEVKQVRRRPPFGKEGAYHTEMRRIVHKEEEPEDDRCEREKLLDSAFCRETQLLEAERRKLSARRALL